MDQQLEEDKITLASLSKHNKSIKTLKKLLVEFWTPYIDA